MLKKNDFTILFLLCIIGILLMFIVYIPKTKKGTVLIVRVNGKITSTYPLNTDTLTPLNLKPTVIDSEVIDSKNIDSDEKNAEDYNLLQITNGVASIVEANCKDKLCVHQKSISSAGESIVCLPHRLSLTVSDEEKNSPDAISS